MVSTTGLKLVGFPLEVFLPFAQTSLEGEITEGLGTGTDFVLFLSVVSTTFDFPNDAM